MIVVKSDNFVDVGTIIDAKSMVLTFNLIIFYEVFNSFFSGLILVIYFIIDKLDSENEITSKHNEDRVKKNSMVIGNYFTLHIVIIIM